MKYICRHNDTYWTVPREDMTAQFKAVHRRTGEIKGLGPIVEVVGKDRSTIAVRSRARTSREDLGRPIGEGTQDARGARSSMGYLTVKLLDRHKSIRILPPEADQRLAEHDAEIKRITDELVAARKRRAATVAELWKQSERVPIEELEEKANAAS